MPRVAVPENAVGLAQPAQATFRAADNGGGVIGGIAAGLSEVGRAGAQFAEAGAQIAEHHALTHPRSHGPPSRIA